jgi:hypothetical protein
MPSFISFVLEVRLQRRMCIVITPAMIGCGPELTLHAHITLGYPQGTILKHDIVCEVAATSGRT